MARKRLRRSRGGSIVEFALCLPVLCLLVLGAVDVGRIYSYQEAVANGAREALRVAVSSSQQPTGNAVCAASGGTATVTLPAGAGSTIQTIANAAALESSSNGTAASSPLAGATVTVKWHCAGLLAVTNATNGGVTDPANASSDSVEVTVVDQVALITPLLQQVVNQSALTIRVDLVGRAQY